MSESAGIDALKFFAKITSGSTHELNNIVAIVNELGGSIEDKINSLENFDPDKTVKIVNSINKIYAQIERAKSLTKSLNRFSHSVDSTIENIDIIQLLKDAATLFRYFVKLESANIVENYSSESFPIRTNPFLLFLLLFKCIQTICSGIGSQRDIFLSTETGNPFKIYLKCITRDDVTVSLEQLICSLNEIANLFSIELKIESGADKCKIAIEFNVGNINQNINRGVL